MIAGACLCGAVRYELEDAVRALTHCHCSRCRKHHGAPFASFVDVSQHGFRWTAGEDLVVGFASSPTRQRCFCQICGSVAPGPVGDRFLVPAGNLLGDWGAPAGEHVFVGSKAAWHSITDSLPQHVAGPPGWIGEVEPPTQHSVEGITLGSCACGEISFSVSGTPARWMLCHCSRCRRGRSAAHGSNTFYPLAQFAWRTGREQVRSYRPPDAERFMLCFCGRCGGGAPVERDKVPFVLVPAGLLDGDPGSGPQAHIHVASKASWYTLVDDGLPQFAELPPA